jgi:hypothetical protein
VVVMVAAKAAAMAAKAMVAAMAAKAMVVAATVAVRSSNL